MFELMVVFCVCVLELKRFSHLDPEYYSKTLVKRWISLLDKGQLEEGLTKEEEEERNRTGMIVVFLLVLAIFYWIYMFVWCFDTVPQVKYAGISLLVLSAITMIRKDDLNWKRYDAVFSASALAVVMWARTIGF